MDLVLNLCLWDPSAAEPSLFTKEAQQNPEIQEWNLSTLDLEDFFYSNSDFNSSKNWVATSCTAPYTMSKHLVWILWAGTSTLIRAENNMLPLDNTAQGGGSNETHQGEHILKNIL